MAAITANRGFHANAPSRIRNSPTNPFSPGRPIDDSVTMQKRRDEPRHHVLQAAELGDQPRVPPIRQHADDEEEAAGADAVVQHLVDRALHALRVHRGDAEHDEAEVADARVGDQLLHVRLHHRDQRAVDDADHREHGEIGREVRRRRSGTAETRSAPARRCPSSAARRPGSPSRRSALRRARRAARCGTGRAAP